jgi:hypothetical protein
MFLGLLGGVQVLNFVVPGVYFKYEDTPTSRGVLIHIRKTGSGHMRESCFFRIECWGPIGG